MSSLHDAATSGDLRTVESLLARGADVNEKNPRGNVPLHYASNKGHLDVVTLLLDKGADVNARSAGGTALHAACLGNQMRVAELLLARGVDVHVLSGGDDTALHLAVSVGNADLVRLLLSKGANANAVSFQGGTALHGACILGHGEVVKALLEKGANPDISYRGYGTPVEVARKEGYQEIVAILEQYLAAPPGATPAQDRPVQVRPGGSPSYLPLLFALKDLRIQFYPDQVGAPVEFSRSACLMRADTVLPVMEEAAVEALLQKGPVSPPPADPADALMRAGCPGWPEDALVALRGITAFGAGSIPIAETCALHALQINRSCTLARQLLQMLSEKQDPRVPFSNQAAEVKDALAKMAQGSPVEQSGRPEAASQAPAPAASTPARPVVAAEPAEKTVLFACPSCKAKLRTKCSLGGKRIRCPKCSGIVAVPGPVEIRVITNSIGMKLAVLPAGEFLMGSPDSDGMADDVEKPQHRVRITRAFYLGVYPVTQGEYEQLVPTNLSRWKGDPRRPVEAVDVYDTHTFLTKLTQRPEEKAAGLVYSIPTEAQWEYACRAGGTTRWSFGDDENLLEEYAWYGEKGGKGTHPVGQKKPNAWGLHDMQGNVWEWCNDGWDPKFYGRAPTDDPEGYVASAVTSRVGRGGSWSYPATYCRSAYRLRLVPNDRNGGLGFRVAAIASR